MKFLIGLCLICCCVFAYAQKKYTIDINQLPANTELKKIHISKKLALKEVKNLQLNLIENGYITASVDTFYWDSLTLKTILYLGEKYNLTTFKREGIDEAMLSSIGFRDKIYTGKSFSATKVKNLLFKTVEYYENKGYPFAKASVKVNKIEDNNLHAELNIEKGNFITIDSIIVKGKPKITHQFLYNYLGFKPGDVYNQSLINSIAIRIKEIPFLNEIKPAELLLKPETADIYLYLEDKKASRFNGILGVLPNEQTGKITITGELTINVKNGFGKGEEFGFEWRKLQALTQNLKTHLIYPFLFKTPLGVEADLKIFKKDTTYLEVNPKAKLLYMVKGGNHFSVFYERYSSSILNPDNFKFSTVLPEFANASKNMYGIGVKKQHLDYRINPRKGIDIDLNLAYGFKEIVQLPELDESLYDDVNLKSNQYDLRGKLDFYIPLFKRSTIKLGFNGAHLQSENLFLNEMSRIGGIHTLRGFDEESIIASTFSVLTAEYRFLLEQNSNLYLFTDFAYYETKTPTSYVHDTPLGFGAGISFQTKPGIFSINYALGKQQGNPIIFRAAKVHFGFINYF